MLYRPRQSARTESCRTDSRACVLVSEQFTSAEALQDEASCFLRVGRRHCDCDAFMLSRQGLVSAAHFVPVQPVAFVGRHEQGANSLPISYWTKKMSPDTAASMLSNLSIGQR